LESATQRWSDEFCDVGTDSSGGGFCAGDGF